ncbi:MAG: GLUG motif-containing protein [Bacteroidota bacterium]
MEQLFLSKKTVQREIVKRQFSFFIIILACCIAAVITLLPQQAFAQTATQPSGSGTQADPYLISSLNELYWITQSSGAWSSYFKQTADIDASSTSTWNYDSYYGQYLGFSRIGTFATKFTGQYDGNGHIISGLYMHRYSTEESMFGMFGAVAGEIKNLGVINANITAYITVGIVVGYVEYGTISNCYSTGTITANGGKGGGLVGQNYSGTIVNCYSSASVVSNSGYLGGLVGESDGGNISNSYATGSVTGGDGGNGGIGVGGLVGYMYGPISNCYATGPVSGSAVGGLIGIGDQGNLVNCFSTGAVSGNNTGGLVSFGHQHSPGYITVSNSFWNTDSSGQSTSDGGTGKTTSQMKTLSTFTNAGWDFTNYWKMDGITNDSYPFVIWQTQDTTGTAPSGSGTSGDPYLIIKLANLKWVSDHSSLWSAYFKQTANINAEFTSSWNSGNGFTPIGNSTTSFTGTYNGDGYTISGLTIARSSEDNVGLFGKISSATVKKVFLTNVSITGINYVGALVGLNYNSTIDSSSSSGSVYGGSYVGGLVGQSEFNSQVRYCYSTVNDSGGVAVGGLVGMNYNGSTISNCYATGSAEGTNNVGGLAGAIAVNAVISNSFSTGSVSGSALTGGLVGGSSNGSSATNSFWDTQTSGKSTSAAGTGKATSEMKNAVTFLDAGWSNSLWNIGDGVNSGYPYLDWQNTNGTALMSSIMPSGSGTSGNPYLIATLENLYWVTQNSSSWSSYFKQTANIDASSTSSWDGGSGFIPIGNGSPYFTGTYDGQGYTISNLFISRSGGIGGLFGYATGGTLKNIGLTNLNFTGQQRIGGVAGYISDVIINNCYSTGTISASGGFDVGGLVGRNENSTISNSYSSVSISSTSFYVGGLVGANNGSSASITNCYATGSLNVNTNDVGGLVGVNQGSAQINYSYATGNVDAGGGFQVGGLVGENNSATINNCYAAGNATSTVFYVGGLVGLNTSSATITNSYSKGIPSGSTAGGLVGLNSSSTVTNCFWDTQTSGTSTSSGGTGKTTALLKSPDTYAIAGWDSSYWYREPDQSFNSGYPYLKWQNTSGTPLSLQLVQPSGSGTSADPYLVANLNNLFWITQNNSSWNKYFQQTADINAAQDTSWDGGNGFSPIGNSSTQFTGTYDGNGHTISNLFVNRSSTNTVGMFGYISGATIKNLKLSNVDITGSTYVGGIAGWSYTSSIDSSSAGGNVSGSGVVGGLAGFNDYNSQIRYSYSTATVTGGNSAGGIAGLNYNGSTISRSYATGSVSITAYNAGGVAGANVNSTISNCYSTGNINGNNNIGGLVGSDESGAVVSNSYSTGSVTGSSSVGGLVGTTVSSTVSNSFWDTQTSGQSSSAGGTGKTTSTMKTLSTFAITGWDFYGTPVWNIGNSRNNGYPYLQWQYPSDATQGLPSEISAFPDTANLQIWLRADEGVAAEGGNVLAWYDRSGNNHYTQQNASANQPSFVSAVVNGYPVVRFNGSTGYLPFVSNWDFLVGTNYTIFVVEARSSNKTNNYCIGGSTTVLNSAIHLGYRNDSTVTFAQYANDLDVSVPKYTSQEFTVYTFQLSSAGHAIYNNAGLLASNSNTNPFVSLNDISVGRSFGTAYYGGDIAEVIIYSSALSSNNRNTIENYLLQKYNIATTEPTIASSAATTIPRVGSAVLHWTNGSGASHIVLLKQTSAVDSIPLDGTSYSANPVFRYGSQIGNGNYVVAITSGAEGAQDSVTITGLQANTNYYYAVYEYNGSAGVENYLTSSSLTGNFTTLDHSFSTTLSFDGVNDSVYLPVVTLSTSFASTIELWVKATDTSGSNIFHSFAYDDYDFNGVFDGYEDYYSYDVNIHNGNFEFTFSGYTNVDGSFGGTLITTTNIIPNTWYHVAVIINVGYGQVSLYVNGVNEASGAGPQFYNDPTQGYCSIGSAYGLSAFGGAIDEIRIWNVARSQSEIMNNKDEELSGGESGLIHYWKCNEGSGTTIADAVTAGSVTGTLHNGVAWDNFNGTPLPVELVFFTATTKQNNVELKWSTATEVNNYGFEIERTVISYQSSVINWSKAGFVEGSGTTNAPKEYSFTDSKLTAGKYSYRLKQIDRDGKFEYSQTVEVTIANAPKVFALKQNYPNPFNPTTVISYQLPVNSHVTLKVYDAIGREVATLVDEVKEPGTYSVQFNGATLSSGIYFYTLRAGNFSTTKKLMLVK